MKANIIISKMIVYIDKILKYCSGYSYKSFSCNSILVEACVFNLSQMGELANKIGTEYQQKYPSIPWRQLYGLRNRIIHDYEGVNLVLVWSIIEDDLVDLKASLQKISIN